jgi:16S rRNA processing protein RimM
MTPGDRVSVGVIIGAHGVRGEVKLKSFTAEPAAIARYGPLVTAAGRTVAITGLRGAGDLLIASLQGVADRDAAEALKGADLFADRARLPPPATGEVYLADLAGAVVTDRAGTVIGRVAGFADYGAGDLLDVALEGRKDSVLVPCAPPFVVEARPGRVVLDLPDGYLDEAQR